MPVATIHEIRCFGWSREAAWRCAVQIERDVRLKYHLQPGNIPPPVQEVRGWVVTLPIKMVERPVVPGVTWIDLRKYGPAPKSQASKKKQVKSRAS